MELHLRHPRTLSGNNNQWGPCRQQCLRCARGSMNVGFLSFSQHLIVTLIMFPRRIWERMLLHLSYACIPECLGSLQVLSECSQEARWKNKSKRDNWSTSPCSTSVEIFFRSLQGPWFAFAPWLSCCHPAGSTTHLIVNFVLELLCLKPYHPRIKLQVPDLVKPDPSGLIL